MKCRAWYLFAAVLALLVNFPHVSLAQSPDEIVVQARRASAGPEFDMVCDERATISNFVNGGLRSQELQEAIVSTPRRGGGIIDLDSSYRELLRVNGKPVSSDRARDNSTANITTGGAWLGSASGWVFSYRGSFEFKLGDLERPSGLTETLLVLQFERKKGNEAPWFVPDSGKFWLDPKSKRVVRMEIHDASLAPMLSKEATRTITEDFASYIIDNAERWLVRTRTVDYYPNGSNQNFKRTRTEYDKCRKFDVSSTIRPVR